MKEITLNGLWQLRQEPLSCKTDQFRRISKLKSNWIKTPVPGDIRQGLLDADLIKEPTVGLNSFESSWVEKRSWWYRKTFIASKEMLNGDLAELVLDGLDSNASVFLNNNHIGNHSSVFRPFIVRINDYLKQGKNTLIVRLTHGVDTIKPDRINDVGGFLSGPAPKETAHEYSQRGEHRRIFVRKPQYSWGWDWAPRIATCGITKSAKIRIINKAAIRNIRVSPSKYNRKVKLNITLEIEWLNQFRAGNGDICVALTDPDNKQVGFVKRNVLLQSGLNYIDVTINVEKARLWWPSGLGKQDRYKIKAELSCQNRLIQRKEFKYGIRFIKLETDNKFRFSINDKAIFAKGANWVPADSIYARVTDEKVRTLITEARLAGFNMLRIWGGGLYERGAFYEACQENGILVWQDFMFACAPYPDHIKEFRNEIIHEAQYQTRRLQNHCCIALLSGNNECLMNQAPDQEDETECGKQIWGYILPKVVRENCPSIPYWHSSPYGQGDNFRCGDSSSVGDCHLWHPAMMNPDVTKRIIPEVYDSCDAMFVSEYGYPGPCIRESTLEYLDWQEDFNRKSRAWSHHFNAFAGSSIEAGISRHYTGSAEITNDQYFQFGGMVQGLMYEYSIDSLRASENCNGALFWMYNDCWGEVGWTIIDYYLRRKISWYYVKRAMSQRRLILRSRRGKIAVIFSNDSDKAFKGTMEYGFVSLDGKYLSPKRKQVHSAGLSTSIVAEFPKGKYDSRNGIWFARFINDQSIYPGILKVATHRQLRLKKPKLNFKVKKLGTNKYAIRIKSDIFAHAVKLNLPSKVICDENYFDLLPGQNKKINLFSKVKLSKNNISTASIFWSV